MFPSPSQGNLYPRSQYGPDNYGWSFLFDYDGAGNLIYKWWIPVSIGTDVGLGYGQKFTYTGGNVSKVQWAVTAVGGSILQMASFAGRAALTYQ